MKDLTVHIGDLPCLQDMDVSQNVGDLTARLVHAEYRNKYFRKGFGLQTSEMDGDTHLQFFAKRFQNHSMQDCRRAILDTFGCLQVPCTDEIDITEYGADEVERAPRPWHSDYNMYSTLICTDKSDEMGTYTTPNTQDVLPFRHTSIHCDEISRSVIAICKTTEPHIYNDYRSFSTLSYTDRIILHATGAMNGVLYAIDDK